MFIYLHRLIYKPNLKITNESHSIASSCSFYFLCSVRRRSTTHSRKNLLFARRQSAGKHNGGTRLLESAKIRSVGNSRLRSKFTQRGECHHFCRSNRRTGNADR